MKQKLKKWLYSSAILYSSLLSQNTSAQSQLKGWHVAPNLID